MFSENPPKFSRRSDLRYAAKSGSFRNLLELGRSWAAFGASLARRGRDIGRKRLGCMRPQFAAYALVFGGYDWDVVPLWVKDEEILAIGQGHFGDAAATDGAHSG